MAIPRKHHARCRGISLSVSPGPDFGDGDIIEQICDCEVIEAVIEDATKAAVSVFLDSEKYLAGRSKAVADAIHQSARKEK